MKIEEPCIIVSIDKDLLQIPGRHYNFSKREFCQVTEEEALRFFYMQILIGDRTDNIAGCTGIGVVKAQKYLGHLSTEVELYKKVCEVFADKHPEDYLERILKAGRLLKIRTTIEEDLWLPPNVLEDTDLD